MSVKIFESAEVQNFLNLACGLDKAEGNLDMRMDAEDVALGVENGTPRTIEGPTQALLDQLGRHGNRPAYIHFFVTADGHRKLTTQINIDGNPLVNDDFAYATRDGLVPPVIERNDAESIAAAGLDAPFAEIQFDFALSALVDGVDNQVVERPRLVGA